MEKKKMWLALAIVLAVAAIGAVSYYFITKNQTTADQNKPADKYEKYLKLGLTPTDLDKIFAKMDILKKDLKDNPGDYFELIEMGNLNNVLNEYNLAREYYEKAVGVFPDEAMAYNNLADLYVFQFKDPAKALENYQLAIQKNPAYISVYRSIGDMYRSFYPEKTGEIEPLMLAGAKANSGKEAYFYEYLVIYFRQAGDLAKALEYNQKLLVLDPKNAKYQQDRQDIMAAKK
jgi:tetratricopeptide (TPR) repeat protein